MQKLEKTLSGKRMGIPFNRRVRRALQLTHKNPIGLQVYTNGILKSFIPVISFLLSLPAGFILLYPGWGDEILTGLREYRVIVVAIIAAPLLVALITTSWAFWVRLKETNSSLLNKLITGIEDTPSTIRFTEKNGLENIVVGGAIEIAAHPFNDKRLTDNGWDPDDVEIIRPKRSSAYKNPMDSDYEAVGYNGKKYSLFKHSKPVTDDFSKFQLEVIETDYHTIEAWRHKFGDDEVTRHQMLNINPEKNVIPHSLCLHFVCLLKNNEILCLKRRSETSYFPNAFSISFEEQLADVDLEYKGVKPAMNWFRRAICEEVFPLAGAYESEPQQAWNEISQHVLFMRYWSLLLEETIGNFSLFGVCKIDLTPDEFLTVCGDISSRNNSSRDNEGNLYYMHDTHLKDLLESGRGIAFPLIRAATSGDKLSKSVAIEKLHPTSAYRGSSVLSCL